MILPGLADSYNLQRQQIAERITMRSCLIALLLSICSLTALPTASEILKKKKGPMFVGIFRDHYCSSQTLQSQNNTY